MNTFSHVLIGKLLFNYLSREYGIHLDEKSFVRGNYSPDFSVGLFVQPHYMKYKYKFVEREIEALSGLNLDSADIGREPSKRLGTVCHYIADFFCFAHNDCFTGNMALHVEYERKLHRALSRRRDTLSTLPYLVGPERAYTPGEISAKLRAYYEDYLRASKSMNNDIAFSMQVCAETVAALLLRSSCTGGAKALSA